MEDSLAFVDWRPGMPVKEQRDQARTVGVPESKIYEIGKDSIESVDHFIDALRPSSIAYVAGLHVLARTVTELDRVVSAIAAKGAQIVDMNIAEPHAAIFAARRRLNGLARIPSSAEAERRGRKGGKAAWEGKTLQLTEKHEAMWCDVETYPTNRQAAAAIAKDLKLPVADVKVSQVRYRFGPSGRGPDARA